MGCAIWRWKMIAMENTDVAPYPVGEIWAFKALFGEQPFFISSSDSSKLIILLFKSSEHNYQCKYLPEKCVCEKESKEWFCCDCSIWNFNAVSLSHINSVWRLVVANRTNIFQFVIKREIYEWKIQNDCNNKANNSNNIYRKHN